MCYPFNISQNEKVNNFLNELSKIVVNEYLRRHSMGHKLILPSVCLGQAALESGWNLNAPTVFGIKGDDIILDTTEYINDEFVNVKASFATYPNLAKAVEGYYDLMQWDNYDDATSANTVEGQLEGLTNDIGYPYATAPNYNEVVLSIINDFNIRVYDDYVMDLIEHDQKEKTDIIINDKKYKVVYDADCHILLERM